MTHFKPGDLCVHKLSGSVGVILSEVASKDQGGPLFTLRTRIQSGATIELTAAEVELLAVYDPVIMNEPSVTLEAIEEIGPGACEKQSLALLRYFRQVNRKVRDQITKADPWVNAVDLDRIALDLGLINSDGYSFEDTAALDQGAGS